MKKVLYICLALIIISCGNTNKENKKAVKEVNDEEINIENIFGVWEGIQEPYYLVDKFGDYVEIRGKRVLIPEVEYSFLLEENNQLSIRQRSDGSSYNYSGTYGLVNSNDNNLNLSCQAIHDKYASLDLDIEYDKKNDFIRVSTKDKTPHFNLKRKGTISSSENKPSEIAEAVEQSKDINLAIITDPNGTTNVRLGKGTNSSVIYELKTNEVFDVYPNSDKWWLVELRNKQKGYIFYDRVSLIRNGLDGKYTDVSNYFLKEDDLESFSNDELKIMRNEIFARNGYIFKEGGEMNNYFMNENWYKPKLKNVDANLTQLEKYNIQLIRKVENRNSNSSSSSSGNNSNSTSAKVTSYEAEAFMQDRCKTINQTLLKKKTVNFDGTKLFMFMSVAENGYVCISTVSENALEILAVGCGPSERKIQEWNAVD